MPKTILVKARKGIRVFFPLNIAAAPGRRTKFIEGEEVIEVDGDHHFIRRLRRCGDLLVLKTEKPKPKRKPESKPDGGDK